MRSLPSWRYPCFRAAVALCVLLCIVFYKVACAAQARGQGSGGQRQVAGGRAQTSRRRHQRCLAAPPGSARALPLGDLRQQGRRCCGIRGRRAAQKPQAGGTRAAHLLDWCVGASDPCAAADPNHPHSLTNPHHSAARQAVPPGGVRCTLVKPGRQARVRQRHRQGGRAAQAGRHACTQVLHACERGAGRSRQAAP